MENNGQVEANIVRLIDIPGRGVVCAPPPEAGDTPPQVPRALQEVYVSLRRGDLPLAEALMQDLELEEPDNFSLISCRIFWMMLAGDISSAHVLLGKLDAEADRFSSIRAARAAVLLITGKTDDASKLLNEVLDQEPQHELARYLLALWKAQSGDLQIAHDTLVGLCKDYPDHALARLQLGQVLMAAGDIARAGTLFESAIDSAPNLVQAFERFASLLVLGGQPQEAMGVAKRGLSLHPGSRSLLEVLARAALSMGAADVALDATRLVLVTAAGDPAAHANHAVALTAAGRRDAAMAAVKAASIKFPDDVSLKQLANEIEAVNQPS